MTTLLEAFQEADGRRAAVGHFNVSHLGTLHGILQRARELGVPIIVGASKVERQFNGVDQLVAIARSLGERGGQAILRNADPTHSLAGALEAAKAGFDWVVCDFSALPFAQNVPQTNAAVQTLKAVRPYVPGER